MILTAFEALWEEGRRIWSSVKIPESLELCKLSSVGQAVGVWRARMLRKDVSEGNKDDQELGWRPFVYYTPTKGLASFCPAL